MKKIVKFIREIAWSGYWAVMLECGHEGRAKTRRDTMADCQPCKMR